MSKAQVYETLPYDLSGSRSKNRFRNELLWGLEKLYEVYKTEENFCIIFDYACDIEIHFDNRFEFYQIKTSNKGEAYTIGKISNPDGQGNSILGKVYILKKHIDDSTEELKTKIAIVVNVPLKTLDETIHSSERELNLSEIRDKKEAKRKCDRYDGDVKKQSINKIIENLKSELKSDNIDLSSAYYINSSLDLISPENTLLGVTLKFIVDITGKESIKTRGLYRILVDIINEKACYELECKKYDEVIKYKGITREEFEEILNRYINVAEDYIKEGKDLIKCNYAYADGIRLGRAFAAVVIELKTNSILNNLKEKIIKFIDENLDKFNECLVDNVTWLLSEFNEEFPIEYSEHEKMALIIFVLAKYKEDSYE